MTKIKKFTAALIAVILAFSVCAVPTFADGETVYNYKDEDWYNAKYDADAGEFVKYGKAYAMFQVTTKTTMTVDAAKEIPLSDSTAVANYDSEAIKIEAFYAFNCPSCGKANGGTSLNDIYDGNVYTFYEHKGEYESRETSCEEGTCYWCGEKLPDPSTLDVYRFIITDLKSAHKNVFYAYDFTDSAKSVFGATAGDYAGGKDLPEMCLHFADTMINQTQLKIEGVPQVDENQKPIMDPATGEEACVLESFDTSYKWSFDDISWGSFLWFLVVKIQVFLGKLNSSQLVSSMTKVKVWLTRYTTPMKFLVYPLVLFWDILDPILNELLGGLL